MRDLMTAKERLKPKDNKWLTNLIIAVALTLMATFIYLILSAPAEVI